MNDAEDLLICRECDNPASEMCNSLPRLCGRKKAKEEADGKAAEEIRLVDRKEDLLYNDSD